MRWACYLVRVEFTAGCTRLICLCKMLLDLNGLLFLDGEPQDGHLMQQQNQVLSDQNEGSEIEQQELGNIHILPKHFYGKGGYMKS